MEEIYYIRTITEEVFKKLIDVSDEPIMSMADFTPKFKSTTVEATNEITIEKKPSLQDDQKSNQPHAFTVSMEWFYKICKAIKQNREMLGEQYYLLPDGKKIPRIDKLDTIIKKIDQVENPAIKSEFVSIGDPKLCYLLVYRPESYSRLYEKFYLRKKVTDYKQLVQIMNIFISEPHHYPNGALPIIRSLQHRRQ
jgi:hypothetical protein